MLDGFGGLHVFGSAQVNSANAPYWSNWDIARGIALSPGGSGGWELDGFGGVHPFGGAPAATGAPYWPYWDIARAIVMLPNGTQGYELDGFGGVHPLGGAPWLQGYPYWPGWDIARGLAIHLNGQGVPDGGWTLDGFGGIHAFGAAPALANPEYFPGWDVSLKLQVVPGGAYVLDRMGIVRTIGSPGQPDWSGYPSWGGWDIVQDVAVVNPQAGAPALSPDPAELGGLMSAVQSGDRGAAGLGGLRADPSLIGIAGNGIGYDLAACGGPSVNIADRSQDMYQRAYFGHQIPGCAGSQSVFSTYMRGLRWSWAGENIAWLGGDTNPVDAIWRVNTMWLNSSPHRANIMSPRFSSVGCGADFTLNGSYQGYSGPIWVWTCEFIG